MLKGIFRTFFKKPNRPTIANVISYSTDMNGMLRLNLTTDPVFNLMSINSSSSTYRVPVRLSDSTSNDTLERILLRRILLRLMRCNALSRVDPAGPS